MNKEKKIAILIDVDNISAKYLDIIIDQANQVGRITIIKAYGDWSENRLSPWKECANKHSLTYVQQYSNISNKSNVSDFTMIIDAMDLLYSGKVDAFCIVSSDSDFTKLVIRLKEDGLFLFGMGETKTPEVLVNSYAEFVYLDTIYNELNPPKKELKPSKTAKPTITSLKTIVANVKQMINENKDDDNWAYWSRIADLLKKKFPAFHPRNYGKQSTVLNFFTEIKDFEVRKDGTIAYIRVKK